MLNYQMTSDLNDYLPLFLFSLPFPIFNIFVLNWNWHDYK